MAAPASVTLSNLTGKFVMNKTLSDDFDAILALQGVGWIKRKAVGLATVTLHIKQYTDEKGTVHVDIEQTATGGIKGTTELRQLDWQEGEHEDDLFGKVKGKSRWIKLSEIEDPFLKKGWLPEMEQSDMIQSYVESKTNGWTADQVWGFEEVQGKRYYSRHVVVKKGKEVKTARLLYDYQAK